MRTVIVTGAARGIGLAATKLFVSHGFQVAMIDRDSETLNAAKASVNNAKAFECDVSQPDAVGKMVSSVLDWAGQIDCLVNNAGVADFSPVEKTNFEHWRNIMATNLDGSYLCALAVIHELKKTQGTIVNIASISGLRASTLRVAYGTSKAGIIHLTRQLAVELGEYGIRVNCVAPGPVRTKLAIEVHSQAIIDAYHDAIPLNRYGSEDEIAEAIVFLGANKSSYITGQTLAVDGGFEATGVGLPALRSQS